MHRIRPRHEGAELFSRVPPAGKRKSSNSRGIFRACAWQFCPGCLAYLHEVRHSPHGLRSHPPPECPETQAPDPRNRSASPSLQPSGREWPELETCRLRRLQHPRGGLHLQSLPRRHCRPGPIQGAGRHLSPERGRICRNLRQRPPRPAALGTRLVGLWRLLR